MKEIKIENMKKIKEAYDIAKSKGEIKTTTFNYDLERMKNAVEAPIVMIPHGLNSIQIHEFLMNVKSEDFKEL